MSDTLGSLLGSAGTNSKIRKKGSKYVIEGVGEFDSYAAAEKALSLEPLKGEGPMMTTGESAMDWGDEHQPGSKTPNSTATPSSNPIPEKPEWVLTSERRAGVEYEWDQQAKQWRPRKTNAVRGAPVKPQGDPQ